MGGYSFFAFRKKAIILGTGSGTKKDTNTCVRVTRSDTLIMASTCIMLGRKQGKVQARLYIYENTLSSLYFS